MAKISLIMPCFNVKEYVKDAVNSVLSQNLEDIELIAIDDGSVDGTLEVLNSVDDKRLKVIHQKNSGASFARNVGLAHASGEYLAFIDGDDELSGGVLGEMFEMISSTKSDILVCDFFRFNQTSQTYCTNFIAKDGVVDKNEYFKSYFLSIQDNPCYPSVWGKLYKSSLIKENKIKFIDEVFTAEDVNFSAKVLINASKICKLNRAIYRYRIGENNLSAVIKLKVYSDIKIVCEDLKNYLNSKNLDEEQKALLSLYLIKTRFIGALSASKSPIYDDIISLTYPDIKEAMTQSGFHLLPNRYKMLFYLYKICPTVGVYKFFLQLIRQIYTFISRARAT